MDVLAISGSLRAASTDTAVLRTAAAVAPSGVTVTVYDGMDRLPHFNPDHDVDPLPSEVAALRAAIERVDALLFSTPEYAGALPGSFKNLLDWTVGGIEINDKPVGWINPSTSPSGARLAHESLRHVLEYVGASIIDDACMHVPVLRDAVGGDGLVEPDDLRAQIADVLRALQGRVGETSSTSKPSRSSR